MLKRKRRSRRNRTQYRHRLEPLERRILLTTLFGGEVFEYQSANPANPEEAGPIVRVAIDGDATVELIAADIDDVNTAVLGDVPGTIYKSDIGRTGAEILGGTGGIDGIELIGSTPIADLAFRQPNLADYDTDGEGEGEGVDLQALASNDGGETFAFNVASVDIAEDVDRQLIQVVQLSNSDGDGVVQATLHQATLGEDIMSNLSLDIGNVQAFAVDPTSGLAYAVSGTNLFEIDRTSGGVTFVGPVNSGGFDFTTMATSLPDEQIVGLASDANSIFYSLFDGPILNNTLLASSDAADPNPVNAVNGDLGAAFNFTALAVGQNQNEAGFAINNNGGVLELYRLPRDDGSATGIPGAALTPMLVGAIQDDQGNRVEGIAAIDLSSGGNLFGIGTRPEVNAGREQEAFQIDTGNGVAHVVAKIELSDGPLTDPITALAVDEDNQLHATARIGDEDVLIRIDPRFNVLPSSSTQLTPPGSVSANLVGLTALIDPAETDAEHGKLFSVYDDNLLNNFLATTAGNGDLDGDGDVDDTTLLNPLTSISGDLGTNDFNFVALAVNPNNANTTMAINERGNGFELVQINRGADGLTDLVNPTTTLGEITDALGNVIVELAALELGVGDTPHAVGFNADAPVPTVSVGGDLGADFDFRAVTAAPTPNGTALFAINANDNGTPADTSDDFFELYQISRDPDTKVINAALAENPILIGRIRDTNNLSVLNIGALDADPITGQIFVIGTRGANSQRELFEINPITGIALFQGGVVANFDGDETSEPVTDQVSALAIRQLVLEPPSLADLITGTISNQTLSTGAGDGSLTVGVDAFGSFGSGVGGGVTDAMYDPIGEIGSEGTTSQSGVAITSGSRTFLTNGSIGSSSGGTITSNPVGTADAIASSFTFGNLSFDLIQAVFPLVDSTGAIGGSMLTQQYTVANTGTSTENFDLARYLDGDLFFESSGFNDGGGGRLVFADGTEVLFETESGGTSSDDTTFVGITAEGGTLSDVGRFAIGPYPQLQDNLITGAVPDGAIFGDGDGDQFVDPGSEYDVTLAFTNAFSLEPGESTVYTSNTIFGSAAPGEVLTVDPRSELWATLAQTTADGDVDQLVRVDLSEITPGQDIEVESIGPIQTASATNNNGTLISDFDFAPNGDLLGNDTSQGLGQHQLVAIDLNDPANSTIRTNALANVAVNDNLVGLTGGPDGRFLALFDDGPDNDELWISPNELFSISQTPVDLDGDGLAEEVHATAVTTLNVGDGRTSTSPVNALAYNPSTDLFYAVERAFVPGQGAIDRLFTADANLATDAITDIGEVQLGEAPTQLGAIAFTDTLALMGIDESGGPGTHAIVQIDPVAPATGTVQLTTSGRYSDDLVGLSFNADGLAFSLFDTSSMNDALVSGAGDRIPLPIGNFSGATNDLSLTTMTAVDDPGGQDDGRIIAIHAVGAMAFLNEVTFNADGSVDAYSQIGNSFLQSGGSIRDINGAVYDTANNRLLLVGDQGGDKSVFTFDINSGSPNVATAAVALDDGAAVTDTIKALARSADGTLFGIRDVAETDTLVTINPTTGTVTTVATGEVQVNGVTAVIPFMAFDPTGQLIAGDDSGPLRRSIVVNIAQPNHSQVQTDGGTLDANLIGLSFRQGRSLSILDDGENPDVLALGGHVPLSFVNGDLRNDLPLTALAATTSNTFAIFDNNGTFELHQIARDETTGNVTDVARLGDITDTSGNPISNVFALDARPGTNDLYAVGLGAPVPSANVGENLGADFDIVGLTFVSETQFEAVNRTTNSSGEEVFELLSITIDAVTGEVTEARVAGEIRNPNGEGDEAHRIINIDTIATGMGPADERGIFGFNVDAPVPTASIGELGAVGDVIGQETFYGFTIASDDKFYSVISGDGPVALHEIVRDPTTGAAADFPKIGDLVDPAGNPVTFVLDAIADHPSHPEQLYIVAPNADFDMALWIVDAATAIATEQIVLTQGGQAVFDTYDELVFQPDGSRLIAAVSDQEDPEAPFTDFFFIDPVTGVVTTGPSITEYLVAMDFQVNGPGSADDALLGIIGVFDIMEITRQLVRFDVDAQAEVITILTDLPADPEEGDPADPGTPYVVPGLFGYQFDSNGRAYSIFENWLGSDMVFVSSDDFYLLNEAGVATYQNSAATVRDYGGGSQAVAITRPLTGMVQKSLLNRFAVYNEAGVDRLVKIGLAPSGGVNGVGIIPLTPLGATAADDTRIMVDGVDTQLTGLAFNQAGDLIGLNTVDGAPNHLIKIGYDEPPFPSESSLLVPFGTIDQDLIGFTSNNLTRFYSINNLGPAPDELWVNTQQLLQMGTTPLDIDADGIEDEIAATVLGPLTDGVAQVAEDIVALAFEPDGTNIVAVRDELTRETLIQIDPSTAEFTTISPILVDGDNTDVVGMDFNLDGHLVGLDEALGPQLRRMILISLPRDAEDLGVIQVDGQNTMVSAMDFNGTGQLIAFDDSQGMTNRRLIEVAIDGPELSTTVEGAGPIAENLVGMSIDSADRSHSLLADNIINSGLYVSNSPPVASVNGDLGTNLSWTAVTVDPNGRVFAIDNPGPDVFDLYRLDDDTSSSTDPVRLGTLTNIVGTRITDINALESGGVDPLTGVISLTFVGKSGFGQTLFTLNPDQAPTDSDDDTVIDELIPLNTVALTEDSLAVSDPVHALAFLGTTLFGVSRRDDQDRFVELNPTSGALIDHGVVTVNGADTFIVGMDARDTTGDSVPDDLVVIDRNQNQLVTISHVTGSVVSRISAMAFTSDGQLQVIAQGFEGIQGNDLIKLDKDNATFAPAGVRSILVDGVESSLTYTGLAFQTDSTAFAVAQGVEEENTDESLTNLYRLPVGGSGTTVAANLIGTVVAEESTATAIDGLAFAINRSEQEILVGLDNGQIDEESGVVSPRLVSISTFTGQANGLNEAGTIPALGGLSSIIETGDRRPLLYATSGTQLIRGTAVSLPIDAENGSSAVSTVLAADFEPGEADTGAFGIDVLGSFPGLDFNDGGTVPPDTAIAVGPDHIIEIAGQSITYLDKTTGARLFQQPLASFFVSVNPGVDLADPVVAYDEIAQRFFVGALDSDDPNQESFFLYAVSDTVNPLDGFSEMHRFQVDDPGEVFFGRTEAEFLRSGYNADAHVFAMNMRTFDNGAFDHSSLFIVDKSTALDLDRSTISFNDNLDCFVGNIDCDARNSSMVPASMHGAKDGDPMWIVSTDASSDTITVTRLDNPLAAEPTLTNTDLLVATFGEPTPANQPGADQLSTTDSRMVSVAWRNDRLVAAHAIGSAADTAVIRWYDIATTDVPGINQSGQIDQGIGVWAYYPSIEINAEGDLGLTFMQSSETQFMSMFVTGQEIDDQPGSMRVPVEIKGGEANYSSTFEDSPRLAGRTSGISIDPVDEETFWVANEYATSEVTNNWGTFIGHFQLIEPTGAAEAEAGRLFFVAASGEGDINFLYTLDASATNRSAIQNSLVQIPGSFGQSGEDTRVVYSIAWDAVPEGNELVGFVVVGDDGQLVEVDTTSASLSLYGPTVTLGDEPVADITAIEFATPSPFLREEFVHAVQNSAADSQLLRIRRDTGGVFILGPLHDPDDLDSELNPDHTEDDVGPVRGEDLGGMSWHNDIFNPFTGNLGALLATDATSDELVFVDHRPRFPAADIFTIYISHSSPDTNIILATVPPFDPANPTDERAMEPFSGSIGSLRVIPAAGTDPIVINAKTGTGAVYIGARTENTSGTANTENTAEAVDAEDLFPITEAVLGQQLGVRPARLDDAVGTREDVTAGVRVVPNILEYYSSEEDLAARLMGLNLDEVEGLAVSRDGSQIVVVDSDGRDESGQLITRSGEQDGLTGKVTVGDQVALVDTTSGTGLTASNVIDETSSTNLEAIAGLDFGDPDLDGVEQLYAIYPIGGMPTLGTLDPQTGLFTQIGILNLGPEIEVLSMAFAPGEGTFGNQGLYVVADSGLVVTKAGDAIPNLYEVEYTVDEAGVIDIVVDLLNIGEVIDPEGTHLLVGGMDFDRNGQLFAQDMTMGRLVDLNPTTAVAGGVTATAPGSLRPTVGDISLNFATGQMLAVDNAPGGLNLDNESAAVSPESAALMTIVGTESDTSVKQHLGKVFIGGTLTGRVDIPDSVEQIYAGWILTGATSGQDLSEPLVPQNFFVGGDLRNLTTIGSIGVAELPSDSLDEPEYNAGFDLAVGGKLGQLLTLDSLLGSINVTNRPIDSQFNGLITPVLELEGRPLDGANLDLEQGRRFQGIGTEEEEEEREEASEVEVADLLLDPSFKPGPQLFQSDGAFYNDTFDTAQRLASVHSGVSDVPDQILVSGVLQTDDASLADTVDTYSVPLLAGQTVTAQVFDFILFDDIAFFGGAGLTVVDPDGRTIAGINPLVTERFGVPSLRAPAQFTADRPGEYRFQVTAVDSNMGNIPYLLQITDPGNVGLGGIVTTGHYLQHPNDIAAVLVDNGDLGAISTGGAFLGNEDVAVPRGNLRSIDSASIGRIVGGDFVGAPQLVVPNGSVGLLRASGTSANDTLFINFFSTGFVAPPAIGGDYQLVDAALNFGGGLVADGGIGVIRADSIGGDLSDETDNRPTASLRVNADGIGADGVIDLIDVGDVFSGPPITTGPGGNVRYIRAGGKIFQDLYFGGGLVETTHAPGQSVTITDDSGGIITMSPRALIDDRDNDADASTAFLSVATYGIRGSGGSVVMRVTSSESINISRGGFDDTAPVEVSQVVVNGRGRPVIAGADNRLTQGTAQATDDGGGRTSGETNLDVRIEGNGPIDVFDIVGGNFSNIRNTTGGEIVNIEAATIGHLSSKGSLGLAKHSTPAAVNSRDILADDYPFQQQRIGIISGNIAEVQSKSGVGNFLISGHLGSLTANSDRANAPGEFEGIAAPIRTLGDMRNVQIGEGIAEGGSGIAAQSGLFAGGRIGKVINQGLGSDIRGHIVASGGVDLIDLNDGAIINSVIAGYAELSDVTNSALDVSTTITGDISKINVTGDGGIIGMFINGANIGDIRVRDGFGLIGSTIAAGRIGSDDPGDVGDIVVDGFGIRNVSVFSGISTGDIIATGKGGALTTNMFTPSVRRNEFDPLHANEANDLATALGATTDVAGIIEDVSGVGSRDLGNVSAFEIRSTSDLLLSSFDYANSIKTIKTLDTINGLEVTTGKLNKFSPRSDVSNLQMKVTGAIKRIQINGDFLDSSSIFASGPNGDIKRFKVTGDMDGDVLTDGRMGTFNVGGDLTGDITINATNPGKIALKTFKLGGSLNDGSLNVDGNVGKMIIAGSLGAPGDVLVVNGDVKSLRTGTSKSINGSDVALALKIFGNLGTFSATGSVSGSVSIGGDVKTFTVAADAVTAGTDIVRSNVSILGQAKKVHLQGGNLAPGVDFVAGLEIGRFNLTNGSVGPGASITSAFADIKNVGIKSGSLFGSVLAPNGAIGNLRVTGSDFGDGITPAAIRGQSANSLRFDGSVMDGAAIDIAELLKGLVVGMDIAAGATVNAGETAKVQVGRDLMGAVALGSHTRGTRVTIGRDLGAVTEIDADTHLVVRGNVTNTATVSIGKNLDQFAVDGSVFGDVIVDGSGGQWKANQVEDAVLTTGFDLAQLTVTDEIRNSLIQTGIRPGIDGQFSATTADKDFGEQTTRANIGKVSARSLSDTIIAASGDFNKLTVRSNMVRSTASSGISVGSTAVATVMADASPLTDINEQSEALSGADRHLFHGNFGSVVVTGDEMSDSDITAGVDAGADGRFGTADDTTLYQIPGRPLPEGGGHSHIRTLRAPADADSNVLADSGITGKHFTGAAHVNPDVTYSVLNLTTDFGSPLEEQIGSVASGVTQTFSGITIALAGRAPDAIVDVYDAGPGGNSIDTIVVRNTNQQSVLAITGGGTIGRILTADDAVLATYSYDGTLTGDGVEDTPDLWFDGTANSKYALGTLAEGTTSQIAGDVAKLDVETLGGGRLSVLGDIDRLSIVDGFGGNGLLTNQGTTPSHGISVMSTDATGKTWVVDGATGQLSQVAPETGTVLAGPFTVTDTFTGDPLFLEAMDFDDDGNDPVDPTDDNQLLAVANLFDPSPTQAIGALVDADADAPNLRGLAISSTGKVVAINNDGTDHLVEIDAVTGEMIPIGQLRDIFNNPFGTGTPGEHQVLQIAFDSQDRLLGLVQDRDGTGSTSDASDGIALVRIEPNASDENDVATVSSPASPYLPGLLLDDNGVAVIEEFTAMAVDSTGQIYASRRVGAEDQLVTIAPSGTLTSVGPVKVNGDDTNLIGFGFDGANRLVAYDNDGLSAQLVTVDTTMPESHSADVGDPGLLNPGIEGFAVGHSQTNSTTFAYDAAGVAGGQVFTSGESIRTLGTVDLNNGQFTRRAGLITTPVVDATLDNAGSGNLFLATDDDRLLAFNTTTGALTDAAGTFTDANTNRTISVSNIEFNDADGTLFGIDDDSHRFIGIDPATAAVESLTEPRAVPQSIVTLASDASTGGLLGVDSVSNRFVHFNGITQSALSQGLFADSIGRMEVTGFDPFASRIETTGQGSMTVSIVGDYSANLTTAGSIDSLSINGEFMGNVLAEGEIANTTITGGYSETGLISSENLIGQFSQKGGNFNGAVHASAAGRWQFDAAGSQTAELFVTGPADTLSFRGNFDGTIEVGQVTQKFEVGGVLGATADVAVHGDAAAVTLTGGTETGSLATVDGNIGKLAIGATHKGAVSARMGIDRISMTDVDFGLVAAGLDSGELTVRGNSNSGVYSFGAWIGPDRIYNTNDDLLTGGVLDEASFLGDFRDSVLAVATLPHSEAARAASNNLPADNRAFSGNSATIDISQVDSGEAGGLFDGSLGRLSIKGEITNSMPVAGRQSVVVTANGVTRDTRGAFRFTLAEPTLNDPGGPPTVVGSRIIGDSEIQVTFSEPIPTGSFVLAQDGNDDGDVDDAVDIAGSVEVRDVDDNVIDDTSLLYFTQTTPENNTQGVLQITRPGGFGDRVIITLFGRTLNNDGLPITADDFDTSPTIFDRSGLHSVVRDLNQDGIVEAGEDVFGTILDGDGDGVEGGDVRIEFVLADVADEFEEALAADTLNLPVDGTLVLTSAIAPAGDTDVYHIGANAFEFLSVQLETNVAMQMSVFVHDNQGTPLDNADDTFEMLTRWEDNLPELKYFFFEPSLLDQQTMAFELPPVEDASQPNGLNSTNLDYFVVVSNPASRFPADPGTYQLSFTRSATDAGLGLLPPDEEIAYISNVVGENNNELGANVPKQLVYLDFDGGTVQQVDFFKGDVVNPLDAAEINPLMEGMTDLLINGGTGRDGAPVVGIVELIGQIYQTSPATHPLGQINVEIVEDDLATFDDPAAEGLFLTTVNPADAGLDPEIDFTTILIGQIPFVGTGLLGIASDVDFANLSKGDEAIIFADNFSILNFEISQPDNPSVLAREYAQVMANVSAHELGHLLGLNHTLESTISDDPNNDGDASDSVEAGLPGLVISEPRIDFGSLLDMPISLGTSGVETDDLSQVGMTVQTATEDTLTNLLLWLS